MRVPSPLPQIKFPHAAAWRDRARRTLAAWIGIRTAQGSVPTGAPDKRWLGSAEAIIGVTLIALVGALIPGQWQFTQVQPHPLWIVVLAIAIRYGAPSGYVAGGAAAASLSLALWLRPEARFAPIPAHDLIQPFLFVAVAVVVSHAIQGRRQRLADLEAAHHAAADTLRTVTERYATLTEVKAELEKQIVGLPDSVMTLYEVAKHLETLDADALHPAILALVARFLQTDSCTLYRVDGARLRLLAHLPTDDAGATHAHAPDGVIAEAIRTGRVITVRDRLVRGGPAALATEPVIAAGPLRDGDGAVIGVVAIERLPFLQLTPTNIRLFGMILDWGSAALGNADQYARTHARRLVDETTGAYLPAHAMRIVCEESLRSERYGTPLAIVTMHIKDLAAVRAEVRADVLATAVAVAQLSLRAMDIIGHHPQPGIFLLILPMTETAQAEKVVARIRENIGALALQPYHDRRTLAVRFDILAREGAADVAETAQAGLHALPSHDATSDTDRPAALLHFPMREPDAITAGD